MAGYNICVRHLEKYFGAAHVLRNINLDIPAGEFVALVGKSGCGKSTLLRLISSLESPTSGDIFINGEQTGSGCKAASMEDCSG